MINGRFFTLAEVCEMTGLSPQRVGIIARDEGWAGQRVGVVYPADQVSETLWARARRDLAREMGVKVQGPVYHDDWDRDNCPVCGAFAIWKPAEPNEVQNLELPVYEPGWPWRCVNGHNESEER